MAGAGFGRVSVLQVVEVDMSRDRGRLPRPSASGRLGVFDLGVTVSAVMNRLHCNGSIMSIHLLIQVLVWKELDYGSMTETEKQMLVSEVNLLRELKSPYIVRYYDRIIDRANTTIYIIMEYCKGGDLATIIARNKRDRCSRVLLKYL